MRITLFDGLSVQSGEQTLRQFQTYKTGALLAYLAFYQQRQHSREQLVNLLWPDDRSWFVASEIDFDSTLVGCSAETARRILGSGLEAAIVLPDADLSSTGDQINT